MQNMLCVLTELGHSTTEKLSPSHTMNNKNAPKHNNVKYANGVPHLIFEIWQETHEVGRLAFAYHFRMSSNVKFNY